MPGSGQASGSCSNTVDEEHLGRFVKRKRAAECLIDKLADLEDNLDVRRLNSVDERGAKRITKYLAARERILKSTK